MPGESQPEVQGHKYLIWWKIIVNIIDWGTLWVYTFLWKISGVEAPLPEFHNFLVAAIRFLVLLLILLFSAALVLFWPYVLEKLWISFKDNLQSSQSPQLWKIGALIVLALLSYFLYYIKNHTQFFYGCSELLVGAATCWLGVAEKTKENLAATLALIGGISILIRGWVNVCEGYEQPLNMLRSLTTLGASTHKLDGDNGGSIGRMLGIFAYPPEKVYFSILQRTLA